jgi:hypothetical protein
VPANPLPFSRRIVGESDGERLMAVINWTCTTCGQPVTLTGPDCDSRTHEFLAATGGYAGAGFRMVLTLRRFLNPQCQAGDLEVCVARVTVNLGATPGPGVIRAIAHANHHGLPGFESHSSLSCG